MPDVAPGGVVVSTVGSKHDYADDLIPADEVFTGPSLDQDTEQPHESAPERSDSEPRGGAHA